MRTIQEHNYFSIDATIIADSLNESGDRITTFVVTFPRIVLAEFNTHRVFSRNSASSRAIPARKMVDNVIKHPFIPIAWQEEHSGMQGTTYITDPEKIKDCEFSWLRARDYAKTQAVIMQEMGITKQITNRLLEPYLWHTAIVTSTDFENFFALRAHPDAEIHIAKLADIMLEEYNASTPKFLKDGEWHIPFGDNLDKKRVEKFAWIEHKELGLSPIEVERKIATARCARVSYMNFDGKDDYLSDIELHDRLARVGHWSPFEHCAMAESKIKYSGNFTGFIQYRKMFSGENKKDNRVTKKF